jgi:hypothetical protein
MKERFAMADYKLDDLAVFVAVGREGNFTRAAAALGISPSAVGQRSLTHPHHPQRDPHRSWRNVVSGTGALA